LKPDRPVPLFLSRACTMQVGRIQPKIELNPSTFDPLARLFNFFFFLQKKYISLVHTYKFMYQLRHPFGLIMFL
jgi:hypothetical protein